MFEFLGYMFMLGFILWLAPLVFSLVVGVTVGLVALVVAGVQAVLKG